ncbi:MAG: hypothetical protein HZB62_13030 [Nitrospirae bacterium]|nr:hypothetical protein [Nitrospirota bacterium]
MSRRTIIYLVILIISPVIIYLIWPSDESRIKKLFREGAAAIEQEKIDEVMAKVSFNYTDEYGLTYLFIKEGMTRLFQNMDNIKIEYEITLIDIKDKTATAELDVRVLATRGSDTGYIAGDLSKPFHMKFSLEKERTTWLVIKTEGLPLNF